MYDIQTLRLNSFYVGGLNVLSIEQFSLVRQKAQHETGSS